MSLITIDAQIGNKSVTITYDPHDAEAVKAADVWRKALFGWLDAARIQRACRSEGGDVVTFDGQQCRDYQPNHAAPDCKPPNPCVNT